jgi:SAM-dependent methyltransferase
MFDRVAPRPEALMERAVGEAESLLDVGCGANSPVRRFERRIPFTVGVDLHADAIEDSRRKAIHDEYRRLDVLEIETAFADDSFDAVVAFDLLEHLTEEDGVRLLRMMERIAHRRVVVHTPNGFVPQGATGGNPLQIHRSGWTAHRLQEMGYHVYGTNGVRFLRDAEGGPRWRPARPWNVVARLTQPLVYRVPTWAFHLLAVKSLDRFEPSSG